LAAHLIGANYLGIDAHEAYIREARERHPSARFECTTIERYQGDQGGFDAAVASGVLHHLDDDAVLLLLRKAHDNLRPGGHLVTLDGCFMPTQSAVVRWLLTNDRGRHVRTPEHYLRLAGTVFPRVRTTIREDLLRIPYTHFIMSCSRD
jgi:trans-aconitate methyltransferase